MKMVCWSSEREAGTATGCYCGAIGHYADHQRRRWRCGACVAAMMMGAAAHAAEDPAVAAEVSGALTDTLAESPIDVDVGMVLAALATLTDRAVPVDGDDAGLPTPADSNVRSAPRPDADNDAPAPGPVARLADSAETSGAPRWRVHATDATSASGLSDPRIRTFALALDAVLPRSGITIQPRVQLAYRPRDDGLPNGAANAFDAMSADGNDSGVALRLYGAQPSRAAGVYPFVEADWWQDSRKQTININGTRIDADLLRGLFSFNVGAHGSTRSGVKVWIKIKTGRNAGGIVGARYRW